MSSRKSLASPNKIIAVFLKVLVSSGLLFFVISKIGIGKVFLTLKGINVMSFLIAVLMYPLSVYISSVRWRLFLPSGFRLRRLFSLYLIGSFFNNLLPGAIGGDAVKAYYLYKDTGKGGVAMASVFMDRYVGFSALMFIGLLAFPFGITYFHGSPLMWFLPFAAALFIIASFLVIHLRIGERIRLISEFYSYFHKYKNQKSVIAAAFLISIMIQLTGIFTVYIICLGLGVQVPLTSLFIFIPIISTITTIPVSISGVGLREASFVLLFGSISIDPVSATAVSFAWFMSIAAGSIPGLIEYLIYKKAEEAQAF